MLTPTEIKTLRLNLGMTQQEFAEAVGVKTWVSVSNWERGKYPPCKYSLMRMGWLIEDALRRNGEG